jgi:hypothetical protein
MRYIGGRRERINFVPSKRSFCQEPQRYKRDPCSVEAHEPLRFGPAVTLVDATSIAQLMDPLAIVSISVLAAVAEKQQFGCTSAHQRDDRKAQLDSRRHTPAEKAGRRRMERRPVSLSRASSSFSELIVSSASLISLTDSPTEHV